jgi:hypothetical protein
MLGNAVRFLTRVSVLLLAVALVPLLRFIELDACRDPSAAPYPIEGVSKHDHRGVVVDRKDNLRFVTRVRAAIDGGDDKQKYDGEAVLDSTGTPEPVGGSTERLAASPMLALVSAPRGAPSARGPPR